MTRREALAYDREDGWEDVVAGTYPLGQPSEPLPCDDGELTLEDRVLAYTEGVEAARRIRGYG